MYTVVCRVELSIPWNFYAFIHKLYLLHCNTSKVFRKKILIRFEQKPGWIQASKSWFKWFQKGKKKSSKIKTSWLLCVFVQIYYIKRQANKLVCILVLFTLFIKQVLAIALALFILVGSIWIKYIQQNLNSLSLWRHTLNIQYAFKVHLQITLRIRYEMFRHVNLLHQRSKCFEPKLKVHGTDEKMWHWMVLEWYLYSPNGFLFLASI